MHNLALIGLGIGGQIHINSILRTNYARLSAAVAPLTKENNAVATKYNLELYDNIETLLSHYNIDGVIIASPNDFHLEHLAICILHKLPCLVEKPLASTLEEAREIMKLASSNELTPILVGHHRAHSSLVQESIKIIQSGALGRLTTFIGSAQFYKPEDYFLQGLWRTLEGGGPILINMIHEIDTMQRLLGKITSVCAMSSNAIRGYDVEDTSAMALSFESGVVGTFILSDCTVSSLSWELTSNENTSYPLFPSNAYFVGGTNATLEIPSMRLIHYSNELSKSWWQPLTSTSLSRSSNSPIDNQLLHFTHVIAREQSPLVTVDDAFQNMLVANAMLVSAKSGSIVRL